MTAAIDRAPRGRHITSPSGRTVKIVSNVILGLLGLLFLVPMLWVILASLDPNASFSLSLPARLTLANFSAVLTPTLTAVPLLNSLLLSGGSALVAVVVATLAAYPLSRYRARFNAAVLYIVLFGICLPVTALMVPVYTMFAALNLVDSSGATILFMAATMLPVAVWMMKNFIDGVPIEVEEAAWTDGASSLTALRRVVVPLVRPGIAVVFIFVFVNSWGNFFVPFVLLQSPEKLPGAVSIFAFFGQYGSVQYGQLAAYSIVYSAPVLALYVLVSRLVGGSSALAGAVKG
jgi:multiple sugar transport system permease protein